MTWVQLPFDPDDLSGDLHPVPAPADPAEKHEAIARVDANADSAWKEAAFAVLENLARQQATLSTDDIWDRLRAHGVQVREMRAIGSVMIRARKAGLISRVVKESPSRLGGSRWSVRVWQSNIYEETRRGTTKD